MKTCQWYGKKQQQHLGIEFYSADELLLLIKQTQLSDQ